MDREQAVITRFWQQQENYSYYLVGMSIAALGFVIVNTKGEPFHWSLIPAGLSALSWATSIYSGIRFNQYTTSTLFANAGLLQIQKGVHPLAGMNPIKKQIGRETILEEIDKNKVAVKNLGNRMNFFFYAGIVFYLAWHLLEMYLNT